MRHWIGRWLIGVAIMHTLVGLAFFHQELAGIVQRGVFNSIGSNPSTRLAVWFFFFGATLALAGLTIHTLETSSTAPLTKPIGWSLLALTTTGIILIPASGFWLALPPALAILFKQPNRQP